MGDERNISLLGGGGGVIEGDLGCEFTNMIEIFTWNVLRV
jgi:hypothetical protein